MTDQIPVASAGPATEVDKDGIRRDATAGGAEPLIPDLTPEQEELLRQKHFREFQLDASKNVPAVAKPGNVAADASAPEVVDPDEGWYTHARNADFSLDDLGIKSTSGLFTAESFGPYEQKNLRKLYSRKELSKSKYLLLALEKGILLKGRVPRERFLDQEDPAVKLARSNPEGTFTDPLSATGPNDRNPKYGDNEYDKKLLKLEEKEFNEDLATQKSPNRARIAANR